MILPQRFSDRLDRWVTFRNPWPKIQHDRCQCPVHWPNFPFVMRCQDLARRWWWHLPLEVAAVVAETGNRNMSGSQTFSWTTWQHDCCPKSCRSAGRPGAKKPPPAQSTKVRWCNWKSWLEVNYSVARSISPWVGCASSSEAKITGEI